MLMKPVLDGRGDFEHISPGCSLFIITVTPAVRRVGIEQICWCRLSCVVLHLCSAPVSIEEY